MTDQKQAPPHKKDNRRDQDSGKGAVEQDEQNDGGNTSMQGQLGHRDQNEMLKSSDTDYPEPDGAAEHSGEPQSKKRS